MAGYNKLKKKKGQTIVVGRQMHLFGLVKIGQMQTLTDQPNIGKSQIVG